MRLQAFLNQFRNGERRLRADASLDAQRFGLGEGRAQHFAGLVEQLVGILGRSRGRHQAFHHRRPEVVGFKQQVRAAGELAGLHGGVSPHAVSRGVGPLGRVGEPGGAALAQTTVKDALVKHWKTSAEFTMAVARAMPGDTYNFRPVPQEMSFGQLMAHIGGINLYACAN